VSSFVEVKRHKPAVIFIPNVEAWHAMIPSQAYVAFITMLRSIPPTDPVLLLATAESHASEVPDDILKELFGYSKKNRAEIKRPNKVCFRVTLGSNGFPY